MSTPSSPSARLKLQLREAAGADDITGALTALNSIIAAAAWIAVGSAEQNGSPAAVRARERMRDAAMSNRSGDRSLFELPAAALFGASAPRARGWPPGGSVSWPVAVGAAYGDWLRREIAASEPKAYEELFGWCQVSTFSRQSPLKVELSIAGVGATGFALAGPVGVAPAAFIYLTRAVIDLWQRSSRAREVAASARVAEARALEAKSDAWVRAQATDARAAAEIAQQELRARLLREAPGSIGEETAALAARVALGPALDLSANRSIEKLQLE